MATAKKRKAKVVHLTVATETRLLKRLASEPSIRVSYFFPGSAGCNQMPVALTTTKLGDVTCKRCVRIWPQRIADNAAAIADAAAVAALVRAAKESK